MKSILISRSTIMSMLMTGLLAGGIGFAHAQTGSSSGSDRTGDVLSEPRNSTSEGAAAGQRNLQQDPSTLGKDSSGQDSSSSKRNESNSSGSSSSGSQGSDSSGAVNGGRN